MPMSTATARVLMTLEEKEASYELVLVNIPNGEHKHPDHLARNPFGQIPAFEDGSLMLFESRAVARYVAKKYDSGTDLLRSGNAEEAALVDVWLDVEANHFNPPIYSISYQYVVEENTAKLEKVLDVYEERLSKSKYLAGDFFSLADLSHFPFIRRLLTTPKATLITSRPHVNAWWRPSLRGRHTRRSPPELPLAIEFYCEHDKDELGVISFQ
ncbi:putative glutathione S-transferase GSTF1 [Acorus calamus]|uniref:glutathione transferase n=1 Tax=Acorus calamus TaxID=4465 RepID=A0AAV9F0D8_ACOCL|nr:putative glutathione S-transferase GSTF1 [Acorus calamus]